MQFKYEDILSGGDLRSKGNSDNLLKQIVDQESFDHLFRHLNHESRIVAMRAADCIEKATRKHPEFLDKYKERLFELCVKASNKELVWHLAQLLPRLTLHKSELARAWSILESWALDKNSSRIVRVNALQALADISRQHPDANGQFDTLSVRLKRENIPSLSARIKKIRTEGPLK